MAHVKIVSLYAYCRPSTFAQAAKLRRTAAAKEKELAKSMVSTTICLRLVLNICRKIVKVYITTQI